MSGFFNLKKWGKSRSSRIDSAVESAMKGKKADKPTLGNPEGKKKKKK